MTVGGPHPYGAAPMPYLEVERLFISDDVWMKLVDKHGLDPSVVREHLLVQRRHRFRRRDDRLGMRAMVVLIVDGEQFEVVLRPRTGGLADHWNLATAYRI